MAQKLNEGSIRRNGAVLFFLRTMLFQKRLAVVQGKFKYKINQIEALRTIVPKLFYCQSRGLAAKVSVAMNKEQRAQWSAIETNSFRRAEEEVKFSDKRNTRSKSKMKKR